MAATAFQTPAWLAAWYATIGTAIGEPMLVTISEPAPAKLPRSCRWCGAAIVASPSSSSPTAASATTTARSSDQPRRSIAPARSALWRALRDALPGVDLLRFTKMPTTIDGRVNPLALIDIGHAASVNRNVVTIDGTWERYLKSLERRFRKEIGRSWRVFLGHDGAAFERIVDAERAAQVLAELERQQSAHLKERADYILDRPEVAAFYRKLLADGLADGSVILTALTHDTEVVSALLGIVRGDTFVMVRISSTRLEGMVELLAGTAGHRAHHADAARAGLPALRLLDRELRLQAPARRRAGAAVRPCHRAVTLWPAVPALGPRRAI